MKLALISDIHYYSEKLGTSGTAFQTRERMCQYFLRENGAICDSAFDKIAKSDADAVLICGDLTNNGEKVCHDEIIEKLRELKKSKPVYVVYATHDWCSNGCAKRYDGANVLTDVTTVSPSDLAEMYREFGRDEAVSEFVHENGSVSYAVDLAENLRLLALNDDQNGNGKAGYTDEQMLWIKQMSDFSGDVLVMQHHLIMPGLSNIVNRSQIIGDAENCRTLLASCGIKFVFCGHSHMQRVSKLDGIYQINIPCLTAYPGKILYANCENGKIKLDATEKIEFDFNGQHFDSRYYEKKATALVTDLLRDMSVSRDKLMSDLDTFGISIPNVPIPDSLVTSYGKKLYSGTVGDVLKPINRLIHIVDKNDLKKIEDNKFIDYIETVFRSVFDGSVKKFPTSTPEYNVIMSIVTNPGKLQKLPIKQLKSERFTRLLTEAKATAEKICNPEYDAESVEIQ